MKCKIEELFTLRRETVSSGRFLIVNGDDFISNSPHKLVNYNYAEFPNKKLQRSGYNQFFRKGDILFLTIGVKKKIWMADQEGVCASGNNKIKIIVAETTIVLPLYLIYIFISKKITNWATDCLTGTTVPQINWEVFTTKCVNVPELNWQEKLTHSLLSIEILNKKVEKLFIETTKLISNVFLKLSINNQRNEKLMNYCLIDPPKSGEWEHEQKLTISFLPMKDLQEDSLYTTPLQNKKIEEVYKGYTYFQENDLLIAKITPCFENGKMSIAKNLKNGIGFGSTEFIVLRAKEGILIEWVYYWLRNSDFIKEGEATLEGTAGQQRINLEFLKNYPIPFPSFGAQKTSIQILKKIETFKSTAFSLSNSLLRITQLLQEREEIEVIN